MWVYLRNNFVVGVSFIVANVILTFFHFRIPWRVAVVICGVLMFGYNFASIRALRDRLTSPVTMSVFSAFIMTLITIVVTFYTLVIIFGFNFH